MIRPYTIVVVDDHSLIINAINSLLGNSEKYIFKAGFESFKSFEKFVQQGGEFDILLLDIQLKQEDGLELCKEFCNAHPEIPVIMLSSLTQPAIILDALKKGAKGFLPKNCEYEALIDAFEDVTAGKTYIHKSLSFIPKEEIRTNEYIPKLTRREKEVLQLILEEMTTSEIADKLCLTTSTVESHRSSLFAKTDSKNVVGLVKYTIEKGLLEARGNG